MIMGACHLQKAESCVQAALQSMRAALVPGVLPKTVYDAGECQLQSLLADGWIISQRSGYSIGTTHTLIHARSLCYVIRCREMLGVSSNWTPPTGLLLHLSVLPLTHPHAHAHAHRYRISHGLGRM